MNNIEKMNELENKLIQINNELEKNKNELIQLSFNSQNLNELKLKKENDFSNYKKERDLAYKKYNKNKIEINKKLIEKKKEEDEIIQINNLLTMYGIEMEGLQEISKTTNYLEYEKGEKRIIKNIVSDFPNLKSKNDTLEVLYKKIEDILNLHHMKIKELVLAIKQLEQNTFFDDYINKDENFSNCLLEKQRINSELYNNNLKQKEIQEIIDKLEIKKEEILNKIKDNKIEMKENLILNFKDIINKNKNS